MNEEMEKIAEYERGQRVRSVKPLSLTLRLKEILTWAYTVFEHFHLFSLRMMVKSTLPGTFWMIHGAADQFLRQIAKRGAADMSATGVDWILKMLRLDLRQRKSGR